MSPRIAAPVGASVLLLAALTLTACSGGSSTPVATVAAPASTPSSATVETPTPSATPTAAATSAVFDGNGCPAALVSSLKSSTTGTFKEVNVGALHFPGGLPGVTKGCFISAEVSSAKEVLAFVPGGKTVLAEAKAGLKKAGYAETSSTSGTYIKKTDVWIVSGAGDTSSPLGSLGSTLGDDTVLLVHASAS